MVEWRLSEFKQLVSTWMGDRLVGCASYTTPEFHVRNLLARRPHINQESNIGTSTAAITNAAPLNVINEVS